MRRSPTKGCLWSATRTTAAPQRGAALAMALVTLLVATLITAAVLRGTLAMHRQSKQWHDQLQAEWLAECAIERATLQLTASSDYAGETWRPSLGAVEISVSREVPVKAEITVAARYPDDELRRVLIRRSHTVSLPSSETSPSETAPADPQASAPENRP
jgi:type II secretory pathway component PulK